MITAEFSQDVADMRRAEQDELRRAGYAGEIAADLLDEAEPTCDICGFSEECGVNGEWNGDTGNHYECESAFGVWEPADCDYLPMSD